MGIAQTKKSELFREIEQLPNPCLVELQNFIQYLKFKYSSANVKSERRALQPEKDPILRLIGLADVPSFSDSIDDSFYGAA